MLFYLFVLFTVVPLVELALLIWIGTETAWWVPILTVIATGMAGALLARWQGWRAMARIQDELRAGRVPADAMIDGVLVLVGAILLITPGVLTDVFALALLIPPLRSLVKRALVSALRRRVEIKTTHFTQSYSTGDWDGDGPGGQRDEIVDAKVIRSHVEDAR